MLQGPEHPLAVLTEVVPELFQLLQVIFVHWGGGGDGLGDRVRGLEGKGVRG